MSDVVDDPRDGSPSDPEAVYDTAPPGDPRLLGAAAVLLAIPVVALMLVGTYAREEPRLGPFPFFIWYQFLWVPICSAMTYAAYRLVLRGRPHHSFRSGQGRDGVAGGRS